MWKSKPLLGAILGLILTLPLVGVLYLGFVVAGLPFPPYDLFDWMARVLPGDVVTFGIDAMIDTMLLLRIDVADSAKTAERLSAILLFLGGGVVAGALFLPTISRVRRSRILPGALFGLLFGLPFIFLSFTIGQSGYAPLIKVTWLGGLFAAWGLVFGWAADKVLAPSSAPAESALDSPAESENQAIAAAPVATVERLNRRQFIIQLAAGAATVTVLSGGVGAMLAANERRRLAAAMAPAEKINGQPVLPNANDPVTPAPGTRPEYTPIAEHYKVFLRTDPTYIDEEEWILPIEGLVDNPMMMTLDDFRNNYEAREQYVTLSCISGRVGTSLIGTTKWTGVSVQDVLRDAGVQDNARYLFITSGDGFYETVDLDLIAADERIMFCYEWNDETLPKDHGFPLRIWLPDRFGMKQPKWITHIEVTDSNTPGYWVERNWDEVAQVKTTSVIDTVAVDDAYESGGQMLVPVGGIAYSGDRGISKVQVRVNGGSWQDAQLRSPLSETTWVIWRYDWPFEPGNHTFEVRCTEADGTPQIEERMGNRPSGATGLHSVNERMRAG